MKSVFFVAVIALFVILQVSAYSVICEEHYIPERDVSCYDFQVANNVMRVRINDLTAMNPLIDCRNEKVKNIKKNTKICVSPNFDVKNPTIKRARITSSKVTCKDVTNHVGLREDQAYIIENMNGNVLRCDIISRQVDNVFEYCSDKNYNPDFSSSKRVYN